jgi:hypothetical protein
LIFFNESASCNRVCGLKLDEEEEDLDSAIVSITRYYSTELLKRYQQCTIHDNITAQHGIPLCSIQSLLNNSQFRGKLV